MSKKIAVLFLLGPLLVGWAFGPTQAKYVDDTGVWQYLDHSFIKAAKESSKEYQTFDSAICNNDNLGSLLCFDYGWRNDCLEILATFTLTDNIAYVFPEGSLPILQVQGFEKIDMNPILELEKITKKRIIPWVSDKDYALWRVSVGSLEKVTGNQDSIVYQLLRGDRIDIYYKLQNGTIMHSFESLDGIKPLLENVLEKAAAAKPEGPACK